MTTQIDLDKLEALARAIEVTGAWDFDTADTPYRIAGGEVVGGDALPYGDVYTMKEWETPDGSECLTIAQEVSAQYGRYIAAFDPPTALQIIELARRAPAPADERATYKPRPVQPYGIGELLGIYDACKGDWCAIARAVETRYIAELEATHAALAHQAAPAQPDTLQNDIDMVKGALDLCEPEEQQAFQRILVAMKGANRG